MFTLPSSLALYKSQDSHDLLAGVPYHVREHLTRSSTPAFSSRETLYSGSSNINRLQLLHTVATLYPAEPNDDEAL